MRPCCPRWVYISNANISAGFIAYNQVEGSIDRVRPYRFILAFYLTIGYQSLGFSLSGNPKVLDNISRWFGSNGNMFTICDLGYFKTSNLYHGDHTAQALLSSYSRPPGRQHNSREPPRSENARPLPGSHVTPRTGTWCPLSHAGSTANDVGIP